MRYGSRDGAGMMRQMMKGRRDLVGRRHLTSFLHVAKRSVSNGAVVGLDL